MAVLDLPVLLALQVRQVRLDQSVRPDLLAQQGQLDRQDQRDQLALLVRQERKELSVLRESRERPVQLVRLD